MDSESEFQNDRNTCGSKKLNFALCLQKLFFEGEFINKISKKP